MRQLAGLLLAASGAALIGSLWLDWYSVGLASAGSPLGDIDASVSGWSVFEWADLLLAAAAGVAVLGGIAVATGASALTLGGIARTVGGVALATVVLRGVFAGPVDQLGLAGADVSRELGVLVALVAAAGILSAAGLIRRGAGLA